MSSRPPRIDVPLTYTGPRRDVLARIGSPWTTDVHDLDQSRRYRYEYNELGYRGPAFDASKPFLAYIFGESDAFGAGVDFDDIWAVKAIRRIAEDRGFSAEDVMILNFAESGASNAYIARQVLTQCAALKPNLCMVGLADHQRTESIVGRNSLSVGPWLENGKARAQVDGSDLPESEKADLYDAIERGRSFLSYIDSERPGGPEQQLYGSVQSVLLMQQCLRAQGVPAVAIGRDIERLVGRSAHHHPVLGPLVDLIDPAFVCATSCHHISGGKTGSDGIHLGVDQHERLADAAVKQLQDPPASWPWGQGTLPQQPMGFREVADVVSSFYEELPFNYHGTDESAAAAARQPTVRTTYLDLHDYLVQRDPLSILEVGSGAGWLSHGLGLHYGAQVRSIDLSPTAVARAKRLGEPLGTENNVSFEVCDVFDFASEDRFDLGVSMGALHHTRDAKSALARMVAHLVPQGHIYLGLYHAPGRRVFLEEMWRIHREEGEEAAFQAYRALDGIHSADETLARSWFRDQVIHPHETQHTLKEVAGWFEEFNLELASTSINRFQTIKSMDRLYRDELKLEKVSKKALFKEKRYYPGFFTVFGRLRPSG